MIDQRALIYGLNASTWCNLKRISYFVLLNQDKIIVSFLHFPEKIRHHGHRKANYLDYCKIKNSGICTVFIAFELVKLQYLDIKSICSVMNQINNP